MLKRRYIGKIISIFMLSFGLIFFVLCLIIVASMIETLLDSDFAEFRDNLSLYLFYLLCSMAIAFSYIFCGVKSFKLKKFSRGLYLSIQILLFIFGLLIVLISLPVALIIPSGFTFDPLSISLLLIGSVHLILFFILLHPKIKNELFTIEIVDYKEFRGGG